MLQLLCSHVNVCFNTFVMVYHHLIMGAFLVLCPFVLIRFYLDSIKLRTLIVLPFLASLCFAWGEFTQCHILSFESQNVLNGYKQLYGYCKYKRRVCRTLRTLNLQTGWFLFQPSKPVFALFLKECLDLLILLLIDF